MYVMNIFWKCAVHLSASTIKDLPYHKHYSYKYLWLFVKKSIVMLIKSWTKRYLFFILTFLVWLVLCVPQNVVTLVMYFDHQDFQGSKTQKNFTCYESHESLMKDLEFWVLGVTINVLGSCGIIGNLFSILILKKLSTKSSFNRLLLGVGNYQGFQIDI